MERKSVIKIGVFFSLFNFFLIALLGLVFRLFPVFSFNGFHYQNWLQVHSHAAFLGWIYTGLATLFWYAFVPDERRLNKHFGILTILLQIPVFGMYFSFPTEGYGPWSIFFLSFHLILFIYLMTFIFRHSTVKKGTAFTLAKIAFWFMVLSAAGPISLGPISAMGLKHTHWYHAAIYFYLHFQYNGWFTIALLALLLAGMEKAGINSSTGETHWLAWIFILSTLLTYSLSLMGFYPEPVNYIPGGIGVIMETAGIYYIIRKYFRYKNTVDGDKTSLDILGGLVITFLALKLLAQLFTAFPFIVEFAYTRRDLVVAYLHLSLLGFASTAVFLFYGWNEWLNFRKAIGLTGLVIFLTGFVISELLLGLRGFFPEVTDKYSLLMICLLIIHAGMKALGIFVIMLSLPFNFARMRA